MIGSGKGTWLFVFGGGESGGFYYMRIFEGMRMERWVGGWRRCGAYREIEIYEE